MKTGSASDPLAGLQAMQHDLRALLAPLGEAAIHTQLHPDLSPLGWHLGHCIFTEALWLARCTGGPPPAAELRTLYDPSFSPKPARGGRLPSKARLLSWARQRQQRHLATLAGMPASAGQAHGITDLALFLLQHHAQHLETMQMALAQRAQQFSAAGALLAAAPPAEESVLLPAGDYPIGCEHSQAYDNEQPRRRLRLPAVRLARWPARNAEYLGFMEDGGYQRRQLWTEAGWHWRQTLAAPQPEHWRRTLAGRWVLLQPAGASRLEADEALLGISLYEAQAYARWAGGRLPHEYEWEAAQAQGLLEGVGWAWEWCQNRFHPYPGFTAFPYAGYSLPWFDGRHYVLRGGSPYTSAWVQRPSFRNFYMAEKRHIFAGCRLAFSA